jgi:hypothetical protein
VCRRWSVPGTQVDNRCFDHWPGLGDKFSKHLGDHSVRDAARGYRGSWAALKHRFELLAESKCHRALSLNPARRDPAICGRSDWSSCGHNSRVAGAEGYPEFDSNVASMPPGGDRRSCVGRQPRVVSVFHYGGDIDIDERDRLGCCTPY